MLDLFGNGFTHRSVDELAINKWDIGISAGYHVNKWLYVGYSLYNSLEMTVLDQWGFTDQGVDGNILVDHTADAIHSLEARFSPFDFGLYLSGSLMSVGGVDYEMEYSRTGRAARLGDNLYVSDVTASWSAPRTAQLGLGIGYNLILESGLSFNLGLSVPVGASDNEDIEVDLVDANIGLLEAADLASAQASLQDERFYRPMVIFINVGYNLSFW